MTVSDHNSPRILVVDDSRLARSALQTALEEAGYTNVLAVGSAIEAFNVLNIQQDGEMTPGKAVDLILMDIVMQDMNGIEACRLIKSIGNLRDIPIIMVTARSDLESLRDAFKAGAMDYIEKPLSEIELKARVHSALIVKREADSRKARERELLELTAKLAQANQQLRRLSSLDGLTEVANRRYLDETLDTEWRRATRPEQWIALVMIDIDHFKNYNDRYGHLKGDDCLREVARVMDGRLRRAGDLLGRYGGEEFLAILPSVDVDKARSLAEELRRAVEGLGIEHDDSATAKVVTVSLGIAAVVPTREDKPEDLLNRADRALYEAKKSGRNRVCG